MGWTIFGTAVLVLVVHEVKLHWRFRRDAADQARKVVDDLGKHFPNTPLGNFQVPYQV